MTTKEIVLSTLKNASSLSKKNTPPVDEFISGETLASLCGISRAAVWKSIKSLKLDGIQIEAVTNRGYRILANNDELDEKEIRAFLPKNFSSNITVFDEIDSTNTECKRQCVASLALRDENKMLTSLGKKLHRSVVVAQSQTNGRGRLGRNFYSPKNSGIYMSIIYAPKNGIIESAKMTVAAAVCTCHVIEKLFECNPKIKWVNDIFCNEKKVCGILTEGVINFESSTIDAAIIGLGINITDGARGFPKNIANKAGSICGTNSSSVPRARVVANIIFELLSTLDELYDSQGEESLAWKKIISEYRARSNLIGCRVQITPVIGNEKNNFFAKVLDIDNKARLVVQDDFGVIKKISAGEVTLQSLNV